MPLSLAELFPDEDYRFHLTLRKGSLDEFFRSPNETILAERRRWLGFEQSKYTIAEANGADGLLSEFETMAARWSPSLASGYSALENNSQRLLRLGSQLEPDFMLLAKDEVGAFRLRAGVVCFPSSWVLAEKMGHTLDDIHGVVPGLNSSLGNPINQFLGKLKPGTPFERANWGLAATAELNLHPDLKRPRLSVASDVLEIWVRIENQILAALPVTGGILFGIRLRLVPLSELLETAQLRRGFNRAIASMPTALAVYKGIEPIRDQLIAASA